MCWQFVIDLLMKSVIVLDSFLFFFSDKDFVFSISSHVLTEDTISREIRNGKLHSKRLLSKTNSLPKWGERFYNAKAVKIVEESVVDPKEKTLTTYTRNIAFTKVMVSIDYFPFWTTA